MRWWESDELLISDRVNTVDGDICVAHVECYSEVSCTQNAGFSGLLRFEVKSLRVSVAGFSRVGVAIFMLRVTRGVLLGYIAAWRFAETTALPHISGLLTYISSKVSAG
jgi:hypothetical protein